MLDNHSLQIAVQNGIIDEDEIRLRIEMYERDHYLEKHPHKIWQGKSGEWFSYLPDTTKPKQRRMIKKSKRESVEDAIVEWWKEHHKDIMLPEVFLQWLEEKAFYGEIKKQTCDKYICDYNRYFKGTEIEMYPFQYITEDMLKHFIKTTIRDKELTAKAWSGMRTLIYGMFKYAKDKGYTAISITNFMGDLTLSKNSFRRRVFTAEESVFTLEEVKMIESYIYSKSPSLLDLGILFGFETGLRIGEISGLKLSDISLEYGVANIHRKETKCKDDNGKTKFIIEDYTKGRDGSRSIVLTEKAVDIIKQCRRINPFGEYLFISDITGNRIHGTHFSQKLTRICTKLGIKKRSMHKARKTYATRLFNGNVDELIIMNQMGHTDIATTRKHYLFNNSTTKEALDQVRKAMGGERQNSGHIYYKRA